MSRPMEYPPVVKKLLAAAGASEGAVHPATSVEELVFSVPELLDLVNAWGKAVFSIYSENMRAEHWQRIAEVARLMTTNLAGEIDPAIGLQECEGQ